MRSLRTIKDRSRERSDGDRTIDEVLARRVAPGELTVDRAPDAHRQREDGDGRDRYDGADETGGRTEADDAG